MLDYQVLYDEFLTSGNTLHVYEGDRLLNASTKPMLSPLLNYIETLAQYHRDVVIFDKILGNAAALLYVIANCARAYSPLGSEPAVKTLNAYGISHQVSTIVPYILKPGTVELCPMERLSLDKTPEQFYKAIKNNEFKNKS
jgi:hypothetical protein